MLALALALLGLSVPAQAPPAKAKLELSLRERAGGTPREGSVYLWRIGIPAEPGWTAGDDYVGSFRVPAAGLGIPGLEPGKYRAICDAHAGSAADLPAFEVRAGGPDFVLEIDPPHERETWVEIFDVRGQLFEKAEYKPGSRGGPLKSPAWLSQRRQILEDGTEMPTGQVGGHSISSSSDSGWRKLTRGAHGFSLGVEAEDGQLCATTRAITLRVPDHGTVGGSVRFDSPKEQRYRVLLVEKGSFEGIFTLPDGRDLDLGRLHVQTPLEPDGEPRPAEWWLDVPVRIAIQAPDCKRLELEFRLRDGLPKPRALEKAP